MTQENIYQKVQSLIVKNKTSDVFTFLKAHFPKAESLTILESEYHEVRNAELKGTLDHHQIQIKKNQINDKLLAFAKVGEFQISKKTSNQKFWKPLFYFMLLALPSLIWWNFKSSSLDCPTFANEINNKILVLPFSNLGGIEKNPQLLLCNEINNLANKKQLSINAKVGSSIKNLTIDEIPKIAESCQVDLIVWGTYEQGDSLELILNYYFSNHPDSTKLSEYTTFKNVSSIQKGQMSKKITDAALKLCALTVLREGNIPLAKKWIEKQEVKDENDLTLLERLD